MLVLVCNMMEQLWAFCLLDQEYTSTFLLHPLKTLFKLWVLSSNVICHKYLCVCI